MATVNTLSSSNSTPGADTPVTRDVFSHMQDSLKPEDWSTLRLICSEELWRSARAYPATPQLPLSPASLAAHLDLASKNGFTAAILLDFRDSELDDSGVAQVLRFIASRMHDVKELALFSTRPIDHSLLDVILSAYAPDLASLVVHAPVFGQPARGRSLLRGSPLSRLWAPPHIVRLWWKCDRWTGLRDSVRTFACFRCTGDHPATAFDDLVFLFRKLRKAIVDCRHVHVGFPGDRVKLRDLTLRHGPGDDSGRSVRRLLDRVELGSPHVLTIYEVTQAILLALWDQMYNTPDEVVVFDAAPAHLRLLELTWRTSGRTVRCVQVSADVLNGMLGTDVVRPARMLTLWTLMQWADFAVLADQGSALGVEDLTLFVLDTASERAFIGDDYVDMLKNHSVHELLSCPHLLDLRIVSRVPDAALPSPAQTPSVFGEDIYSFITGVRGKASHPLRTLHLRGVQLEDPNDLLSGLAERLIVEA
ncbi:hypothetical protein AURDEDRAFT_153941 [Auricularia subglabra TFB-10046 SS5]|uniref:Uncharacterized protein n=1 Tax=Auricularia subglabra (strain TFB-10046 / SS5) TaxID=717982 RepID=J0LIJ1_AURST|nr:hypothetical protein AURDEDRAFT_153941 [Auricularia subglabra TFB-10046 SS5]